MPGLVRFMLGGQTYMNNSIVAINDIGEGNNTSGEDSALLCVTDNVDCCNNTNGEFYYPNNSAVGFSSTNSWYRNRGPQVVRLNRRNGVLSPTGRYKCEVPDFSGMNQSIYITVRGIIVLNL